AVPPRTPTQKRARMGAGEIEPCAWPAVGGGESGASPCRRCPRICGRWWNRRSRSVPEVAMKVFRGDSSGGDFRDYSVDVDEGQVVLDVIHTIQATQANDLAVRWNCKAGKCGSCSAEVNGLPKLMCMTRVNSLPPGEPITVAPIKTFPLIKDLVTDVSFNYAVAKEIPAFKPRPPEADGLYRMMQEDIERGQEFRKCIECFLCQNVCHVIRDHPDNKRAFHGLRFF